MVNKLTYWLLPGINLPEVTTVTIPANTKHLYNIYTTSAQRRRRYTNVIQMFCVCWECLQT